MVDSRGDIEKVAHVAFVNPDGSKCLLLSNTGADRKVRIRSGTAMAEIILPANSITNLTWQ